MAKAEWEVYLTCKIELENKIEVEELLEILNVYTDAQNKEPSPLVRFLLDTLIDASDSQL